MTRSVCLFSLLLLLTAAGLTGCMPTANYAMGQLSIGNRWAAWQLIEEELNHPTSTSRAVLCENHIAGLMILSSIANYDYTPSDADQIAQRSYDFIVTHCGDWKEKVLVAENRYGLYFLETKRPGLAIPHFSNIRGLAKPGSYNHIIAETGLADCYACMGKFELRDHHRIKAIAIGKKYVSRPFTPDILDANAIMYGYSNIASASVFKIHDPGMLKANVELNHISVLKQRLDELSLAEERAQNIGEMKALWNEIKSLSNQFISQESIRAELSKATVYKQHLFAAKCFSSAGDTAYARRLLADAERLIEQVHPKNKALALLEVQSTRAKILETEGKLHEAAALRQDWIEKLSEPTGKALSGDDYRLAGLAQETVGNYDLAIAHMENAVAEYEKMRASFQVASRGRVLSGHVVTAYWGLIRSYAGRYLDRGQENDFAGAIRAARMLRARQFGELMGLDIRIEENIDVSSLLHSNELLLNIVVTDRATVIFAVSPDRHAILMIPDKNYEINTMAKRIKTQLSSPGKTDRLTADLNRLSETILTPLIDEIDAAAKLIVIPDGLLNGIPFTVLSKSPDRYEPLIFDHEVVLSPSITHLWAQRNRRYTAASDRLFALADPNYGLRSMPKEHDDETAEFYQRAVSELNLFSPLPETRTEVGNIVRLFAAADVYTVFGDRATETHVKSHPLGNYRYLHFATHGILGNQIPGVHEPALVLAKEPEGTGQDGFLTPGDVEQLNMNCDLTVLSACDTGSGKYYTGEGIMGLSRSFLLAGSRSVIVSLWPVSSEATVELMSLFYQHLRSGKSKAESLRLAQLAMIHLKETRTSSDRGVKVASKTGADTYTAHPFYWAPFVLIGE